MLDLKFIREHAEEVKKGIAAKQLDQKLVDEVLELDEKKRSLIQKLEAERAEKNRIAKEVARNKTDELVERGKIVKYETQAFEKDLKDIEEGLRKLSLNIPNPPASDVKEGKNETENEIIRKWGKPSEYDFKTKDHLEIGKELGIIDVIRAAKVSGGRFNYLIGDAVLLEFALIHYALNFLTKEGFAPVIPPVLTKVSVFHNLGYSEHGGNEGYYLVYDPKKEDPKEEANYYLVGTSEHSIVPYFMGEILDSKDLPKRFVSFSSCFRREAGSYGKDTKGILRVHQFDKVEMVSFTKPEESDKEHEFLLSLEEKLLQGLEIPYQVVKMCSGDLGAPAARKYDLEAWLPGQNRYRELTSTSTTTDFQARRLNIKFRDKGKLEFVHILNGTAFAIGRTIIAILENYQQKDGSVKVPKVLQSYLGKDVIR